MREKIITTTNDIKVAWKNLCHLAEEVSLIMVAGYTIHGALKEGQSWERIIFVGAAMLIALVGAAEFFKHLARKD